MVKITLTDTEHIVTIDGRTSHQSRVRKGFRQDDLLSTTIFHAVLDAAISKWNTKYNKAMAYTDEIVTMARREENLFGKLWKCAKDKRLKINDSKTKVMRIGRTIG